MAALRAAIALAATIIGATGIAAAQAQTVEQFYRDRQIKLIIVTEAGGDYDIWARAIARHMGRFIPGAPIFVPQNMPGGGQLTGTNHLYNVAARDGSVIGMLGRGVAEAALVKNPGVKYDPQKFNWIGSPELTNRVCVAMDAAPVTTAKDLFVKDLIVGGAGAGTAVTSTPVLLKNLLGMRFELVEGYGSSTNVVLAMERGEVQGICQTVTAFENTRPGWIKSGKVRVLFNVERKPVPGLGAPSVYDFTETDEQRQILDFYSSSVELGRPMAAPPEVPADRVAALRRAFDATMTDAAFLEEASKLKMAVNAQTGEEVAATLGRVMKTSPALTAKTEALTHH
jgi:tripartite-type tricarboxylate transporter receptor subunit TctC